MGRNEIHALIERVRTGDQQAFALLLAQYRPLIEASVAKFANEEWARSHREDLRQEATLVFYNSILTYDMEQSEVDFGLYAKICIFHALISQLRWQKKQVAEQWTESADDLLFVRDSEDPTADVLERERIQSLYSVIRQNLSALEYQVWQWYMAGRTAKEIGAQIGKDERSVHNAIYRIRKKLRSLLQ